MAFFLTSPLFTSGQMIPERFLARGAGLSPPLVWRGAPSATRGFALLVEDSDTGHVHWAACDIVADGLPEGAGNPGGAAPHGVLQGTGDGGRAGYDPPDLHGDDGVHAVYFRLAALPSASLGLAEGSPARAVWEAARRHALAEVDLVGLVTGAPASS